MHVRASVLVAGPPHGAWREQLRVTQETLEAIGVRVEQKIVLNKIDRVRITERIALAMELPHALQICAHDPDDIAELRAAILTSVDARARAAALERWKAALHA